MNLRIISGVYGGRPIDAPNNSRTHPMSERVRNALFNSISGELSGVRVLDAFAGTGALGIEALSRGASSVTFVERDRIAQMSIRRNLDTLNINKEHARLVKSPVSSWAEVEKGTYDIIFADPPYHDLQLSTVSKLFRLLNPNGLMVLSHTGRGEVPTPNDKIVVVDNRSYGTAHLTFFRREVT